MKNQNSKKAPNTTQYVATLKKGLKDAVSAIGALVSMTPHSREFGTEVLQPSRDLLKLKPSRSVCGKTRELIFPLAPGFAVRQKRPPAAEPQGH